ncbi:hypothetical protein Cme02nite_38130 [Catellatospora methionotrophica]|uniref:Uncharacterized protein n=2 Tax=Catellatospora methionotrophica TaxID=121620 RepID=A0A8J3PFB1_9ACTN|nr:hypothetical protein Cme02nite_38130 [Catellatospora methionotrophica]
MGYKRPLLNLTFSDPEFEGLNIRAKRLSLGKLFDLMDLESLREAKDRSPEVRDALKQMFRDLSQTIVWWNLEDPNPDDPDGPGIPVPITPEALEGQDFPLVMAVMTAIREATTAVAAPLGPSSSSGDQPLEASLPMDELSPSPTS